ncbi:MAG: hypothetical protein ACP5OG_04745 [Candidatus Nanoarchaeia archaeon]
MVESIFATSFFTHVILPWILVFTLVFAVLQKTKLLGDGKKQIDAIISAVIGLILVAFPYPRDIIVQLMPFLAVLLVVFFVFMLSYGFIFGNTSGDPLQKWVKVALAIVLGIALVIALLVFSGTWGIVYDYTLGGSDKGIIGNVLMVVVIAGVIIAVLVGAKEKKT